MVGAVIITHGRVAEALVDAARAIAGDFSGVATLSVDGAESMEGVREALIMAVRKVDDGDGVLIFTDMFGGTPTNMALSLLKEGKVDVFTGVNLPVLLKYRRYRKTKSLSELAPFLQEYGRKSMVLAGDMLKEKK